MGKAVTVGIFAVCVLGGRAQVANTQRVVATLLVRASARQTSVDELPSGWLRPYPANAPHYFEFVSTIDIQAWATVNPDVEIGKSIATGASVSKEQVYRLFELRFSGFDSTGISLEERRTFSNAAFRDCLEHDVPHQFVVAANDAAVTVCKTVLKTNGVPLEEGDWQPIRLPLHAIYNLDASVPQQRVQLGLNLEVVNSTLRVTVHP